MCKCVPHLVGRLIIHLVLRQGRYWHFSMKYHELPCNSMPYGPRGPPATRFGRHLVATSGLAEDAPHLRK